MNIPALYTLFLESTGVSTDTRKIDQGNLFFALKGPKFNANDFAAKALEIGASIVVIDEEAFLVENDPRCFDCFTKSIQSSSASVDYSDHRTDRIKWQNDFKGAVERSAKAKIQYASYYR
jgi:UDP-N-acetylmuramyl pentapeptide synthase